MAEADDVVSRWEHHALNPVQWPRSKKSTTMATACLVTFIVGLNSTSITTASEAISSEFGLSSDSIEISFFSVTAWNAAAALVPLLTLPLMDTYGVRYGYLAAYVLFALLLIPQALANSFASLIVCRAIAGALGGTLQNAADGIAANIFEHHRDRVLPLTGYVFTLTFGVTMGPVLGAVVQPLNWRWVFWIQLIICASCAPLVFLCVKETRGPVLQRKFTSQRASTDGSQNKRGATRELYSTLMRSVILLATEPTVTFFTLWSSFAFGLVFISTQSIPLVFEHTYDWPVYSGGLVQSAIGLGQIIGLGACFFQNSVYIHSARRNEETHGAPIPESILHISIPSTAVALAGGLFVYGWSIHQPYWVVAAIGLALTGFAGVVIVNSASIYVTDMYSTYAASAIAAVAFGENIFAAVLPLAAKPMYERLGYDWASSLLGFVALALTLIPVMLVWKGRAIRSRSNFHK